MEVVVEQSVLNAVDGLLSLASEVGQARPNQHGAGDVIALNTRLALLVLLDAGSLFESTVKLLELPAHAARLVRHYPNAELVLLRH